MADTQSLNMQANLSTDTQSLNMQANLSTETILEASLSVGAISSGGLTTEQMAQLDAAYQHSQTDNVTDITEIENTISTYVNAHKEELKGDKGDKGDAGEKGDTGEKGEKGDTGAKGDKGDKGDTGATGANGITPTLKIGSTSTGNAGTNASVTMTDSNNMYTLNFVIPKGEKGDKGDKGDTGAKGDAGADGAKGADGITPTLKVGTVTTLAAGSNATVTMSKNNNEYTLNFGIPKGNKGDTGASGGSGETTVINPTITIGTVTNGDTASASITGDSPNYTLNLVLPKGAKGDKGDTGADGAKGDKGDRGEKGTDGVTPTIAVGTTATGEAGTNAEVTMSKSGTTYTFNFVIPKGAKGDTGAAGTNGAKGDKGDKGEKGDTGAKGADGVTPTFEVGTVSTGAAGSTATVTITGTAPNYVLNFTIPKGDKGDAGEAGSGGDVDLTGYAKLTGATFTGNISSPIVAATRYFVTPTLVGEGDDSKYFHRVVFGHNKFDKMEFHEYGGLFSFFQNQKGGVNDGQLLFQISTSGVDSKVPLKENGVRVYSPNNKPTAADLGITTGTNGATFTPAVDDAGNLSWSNDKGLANPATVNIKGDAGAKGDKGEKGDTGAKGDKGDPFTYSDFTPEQLAALKGAKGDKGDTGAKGDKGDKGDTGAKGEKGDPFTYSDFTSEQLSALKGAKGDKGDKGDTGADGVKGDKGDTGAKGADGQTPNISIGTVTTGAAGTNASASISGTTPNLTLNLTIPKGDKGDKGAQGESINKTVSVKSSSSTVKLTDEPYQYLEGSTNITITLPSISTSTDITEIHLFYTCSRAYTLTFPSSIKWQGTLPTIEAGKYYEFILTRLHNGVWLAGVVVYG